MGGPLAGVNVLDFGQAAVGPWAGTLLGFLGANVLKVERPEGEIIRTQPPFQKGLAIAYTAWNMNKKGAVFNMKDPREFKLLEPLVKEADVISENLRPGVMDRLGLGYETAKAINPRVIYASSPGWGFSGPMVNFPGGDPDFQAFSGFASLNGKEDGRGELVRHSYHLDLNASCILAANIIMGLLVRDRTGQGLRVISSHLGSSLSLLSSRAAEYVLTGKVPTCLGSSAAGTAPNQAFLCQDMTWLAVGVETEAQWKELCLAIRREDLLSDPRFSNNLERVKHRKELAQALEKLFSSRPSRWWYNQLTKRGVPAGFFYQFEELRHHLHVKENEYIVEADIPHQGKVLVGGIPWQFSKTSCSMYPAPYPSEHTQEVAEKAFGAFGPSGEHKARKTSPGKDGRAPLAGLRVVDASQGLCGPYVSLLLADAGAEVLKVEPPAGDYARRFAPSTATGDSAAFLFLNRNKKSLALDLEKEEDKKALARLIEKADIFIEDWGVGKATSRGLDYSILSKKNPGLVYCAITPFGERGPFKHLAGSELVVQAMSEYWVSLGEVGQPPLRVGADVANASTGALAFLGILAALYHRQNTGEGQRVAVSLWGTLLCMRQASWSVLGDGIEEWAGPFCWAYTSPPMHGWQTKDNPVYFRLHNASEEEYISLLIDLGMDEVMADERFGNAGRDAVGWGKYAIEVMPIWEKYMKEKTAEEVVEIARSRNSMAVPINNIKEALEHPQMQVLNVIKSMDHPVLGKIRVIGSPFQGPWQAPEPAPAPKLGQHTAEALASLGKKK
ncbi:MAG: CoA transferase [Chloroflexi bacterium]|nr:CoA transferase [Chloroflexota bacterium]